MSARHLGRGLGRAVLVALALLVLSPGCETVHDLFGETSLTAQVAPEAPLVASGTIQVQEIRLGSELGGRIASVAMQQGDVVCAGDEVVTLDATAWELALLPAEAALGVARAELAVLEAGPRAEAVQAARVALALAEAERDGAYTAWQHAVEVVASPQELNGQIIEAQAQIALAEQGVELSKAQLQSAQVQRDIAVQGSIEREAAELQVRAAEYAVVRAEADLTTARALLAHLLGIRQEPLGYIALANAAEGTYTVADAGVAVVQAQLEDLLAGPTAEELAVARAQVRQAESEVNLLQMKIARTCLRSPSDGVVLTQVLQVGELAAPAAPILVIANLADAHLEVFVSEQQIGRVILGQPVTVTVSSLPEHIFSGQVVRIGSAPEYTPRNVATAEERLNTFYEVKIALENPDSLLKPGMPAEAAFATQNQ